jgi:hypothetical protein
MKHRLKWYETMGSEPQIIGGTINDWLKGKFTGNGHIRWENPWFPVSIFPSANPLKLWFLLPIWECPTGKVLQDVHFAWAQRWQVTQYSNPAGNLNVAI